MATFRAPAGNGEVLAVPDFAAVAGLVAENRRKLDRDDVTIGGMSLREQRALARREVLKLARESEGDLREGEAPAEPKAEARREPRPPVLSADAPLLLAGHQPELSHPGVWVKNFALAGLAKKLGGTALNLIVDNDTLKSTSLRFPIIRDRDPKSAHLESLAFDTFTKEEPYETRRVEDADHVCVFDSFADRSRPLWANWGYEPLLWEAWHPIVHHYGPSATIGDRFAGVRQEYERQWACQNLELTVSRMSETDSFARFASHILDDLPRFREVYNAAIRAYREANRVSSENHPAPELLEGEAPFWVRTASGHRERAKPTSDVRNLRPRALTLTLFARLCLGDFFIHGIGGGKYDEVTDAIIRDYFHIEPPAYQVLSATLHLPLTGFPSTLETQRELERYVRDLHWNPQRNLYTPGGVGDRVLDLIARQLSVAGQEPPYSDHVARRAWFRELRAINEHLRPHVADRVQRALAELERVRAEVAANEVLQRRDYSWVLYPEETLRPFLQQFLNV